MILLNTELTLHLKLFHSFYITHESEFANRCIKQQNWSFPCSLLGLDSMTYRKLRWAEGHCRIMMNYIINVWGSVWE